MLASLRSPRTSRLVAPYTRSLARRSYASVTDLARFPQLGAKLHGFTLQRTKHVPELELSALLFQHDQTGADYLHVAREDKNNVFSIGFKTNPPDATGVPHILEHVTLCGSEKFPVRDPFFKMLPRSLQNFMNAFTSADYTMYPFATTNAQDFRNLMGVYLDSTLHPLLKHSDFVQEGWRVGPENPLAQPEGSGEQNKSGKDDLVFKGVVYNEMKGQMSDAMYLYYIRFQESIIPALNNSGGDPAKMTDLTYDQLRNYHKQHYHPSNSKILTYGDQPVEGHLEMLGKSLSEFGQESLEQDVKSPIRLSGPKEVVTKGPIDPLTPPEAQFKTSTTWMMGDTGDIAESFALQIATSILLDGYGAPLYRELIESGLGTDFTPNTGYDTSGRKAVFSVGLNGVTEENVPKVKQVVAETLRETIKKGLDQHKVDGLLHQLELGLKHKTANFGMNLIQRIKPQWFNGIDPFDALQWNSIIESFKAEYAKGGYLEGLLEKYLANDDTLTFTMTPSKDYDADLAAEEATRLQSKIQEVVSKFSSEADAYKHLRERELELLEEQQSDQTAGIDALPTLHVSDVPRQQPKIDMRDSELEGKTKVQWRETATNGLTYFRALAMFKDLPDELRMLVPLFCDALMRIGTKEKSMEELEDLMKLKTGGLSFGYHSTASPFDTQHVQEGLAFTGRALDRNVPAMYELLQTLLLETDFDSSKAHKMIKQLLQSGASGAVDGIASSGHGFAMKYANAGLSPVGRFGEQTGGLTQIKMITSLAAAEDNPEAMSELVSKLKSIQGIVVESMRLQGVRAALTCGADVATSNEEALNRFVRSTSAANLSAPQYTAGSSGQTQHYPPTGRTFFDLPYQVSYSSLAVPMQPYVDPTSAPLTILSQLLTHKHLLHEIREKGGAYGAGASTRAVTGSFNFFSYRDPNPENTLKIVENAGRWASERSWTDKEMEEAKLSVFQSLDAPVSVSAEGMTRFLTGVDGEMEQKRREQLLDVTREDVRTAAESLQRDVQEKGNFVLLGRKKEFVKPGEGWRVEDMGMSGKPEEVEAEAAAAA
ncbi:hypothetical protein KC340_g14900 [Hortaea werneckii]|nr:hypothetical protein KC342_g15256 [Hortaea werneckii]KAI7064248.1 hypothetical protein KC339_g16100 [Hortaea werneckii]KAI7217586.1 hypothetical protein KC365_g12891 [Hortaea werneckii]KAI7297471.1 hypothetical protein KC340_g14900 [Hortaea werneckii]KAI7371445.1 hypothetical protein KC328_g17538 [Hortaea werneckii]